MQLALRISDKTPDTMALFDQHRGPIVSFKDERGNGEHTAYLQRS